MADARGMLFNYAVVTKNVTYPQEVYFRKGLSDRYFHEPCCVQGRRDTPVGINRGLGSCSGDYGVYIFGSWAEIELRTPNPKPPTLRVWRCGRHSQMFTKFVTGATTLHTAVESGSIEKVQKAIRTGGADVNAQDKVRARLPIRRRDIGVGGTFGPAPHLCMHDVSERICSTSL